MVVAFRLTGIDGELDPRAAKFYYNTRTHVGDVKTVTEETQAEPCTEKHFG